MVILMLGLDCMKGEARLIQTRQISIVNNYRLQSTVTSENKLQIQLGQVLRLVKEKQEKGL